MEIFAETERLILREILQTDIEGMFELDSDSDVHKYLGNKPIKAKELILDRIDFIRQQYIDNGIGRWAIIDKQNNEFVGWTGLKLVTETTNNHKDFYDLGYRLIKRYWGKGIATEAAFASIEYAFNKLDTEAVYAMADCENIASNMILRKVGLNLVETFIHDGKLHNWYRIDKNEYEK